MAVLMLILEGEMICSTFLRVVGDRHNVVGVMTFHSLNLIFLIVV